MKYTLEFLKKILDSITEHIVVIDENGSIQFVNNSWISYGTKNNCAVSDDWRGINYLEECDKAASVGDEFGSNAGNGIRSVINERNDIFCFEYPCHSPDVKRWFMMRATPFYAGSKRYFVITHQNITERKLAEEKVLYLARIDGLTNIPNRRTFDEFLNKEWMRCRRLKKPVSLAMVDLDHFKLLNDTYGHQAGDECLVKVGSVLKAYAKRPGDICARYGGEEFAIVWADTPLEESRQLATGLLEAILKLKIENKHSSAGDYMTASIGLSSLVPDTGNDESELISLADSMLYRAKESGRNRVMG